MFYANQACSTASVPRRNTRTPIADDHSQCLDSYYWMGSSFIVQSSLQKLRVRYHRMVGFSWRSPYRQGGLAAAPPPPPGFEFGVLITLPGDTFLSPRLPIGYSITMGFLKTLDMRYTRVIGPSGRSISTPRKVRWRSPRSRS